MDVANKIKILTQNFHQKKFNTVIKECKKIIKIETNNSFIYNLCGLALQNIGQISKSLDYFKNAIRINENNLSAKNNIANSYKNLDELDLAEKFYLEALKINPLYFESLFNYGNLKFDLNKIIEAIELYNKALSVDPRNITVCMNLAISHRSLGDFDKAKEFCNKAIELNPKLIDGHKFLSTLIDYKKDVTHLEVMNKIASEHVVNKEKNAGLYFAIGKAYEDIGDYKNSFKNLKKGNAIKNENVRYNINDDKKLFQNIINIFENIDFEKIQKNSQNQNIIFICGMPRSGTTLIEQIISSNDEVQAGGELTYLDNIINETFFDENRLIKSKIDAEIESKENTINDKYFNKPKIKELKSKFITDKNPLNFLWAGFIKIFFPNSKIIYCSRNPKDLCFSLYKNAFGSSKMNWTYDIKNISTYYNIHLDLIKFWNEKTPNFIYEVNNEKIINNPVKEIKDLNFFLGLSWDEKCLKPHKFNKSPIKTITNVSVRKPINSKSVNSSSNYEKYLSEMFSLLN